MKTLSKFVILLILLGIYSCFNQKKCNVDHFSERLQPMNRILDLTDEGWAVWCCSPIYGPDQKVHVFFVRSPETIANWSTNGEIAHAVADRPEGPYTVLGKGKGERGKERGGKTFPSLFLFHSFKIVL